MAKEHDIKIKYMDNRVSEGTITVNLKKDIIVPLSENGLNETLINAINEIALVSETYSITVDSMEIVVEGKTENLRNGYNFALLEALNAIEFGDTDFTDVFTLQNMKFTEAIGTNGQGEQKLNLDSDISVLAEKVEKISLESKEDISGAKIHKECSIEMFTPNADGKKFTFDLHFDIDTRDSQKLKEPIMGGEHIPLAVALEDRLGEKGFCLKDINKVIIGDVACDIAGSNNLVDIPNTIANVIGITDLMREYNLTDTFCIGDVTVSEINLE